MKIRIFGTVLLMLLALSLTSIISADGITKRVRFAKGKSSTVISESVLRGDADTYIVGARKGQTLSVKITSVEDNAVFRVMNADDEYLQNAGDEEDGKTVWSGKLPQTGDYNIVVSGTRGNASYKLTISIK